MSERRGFGDFVDRLTSIAALVTAVAAVGIAVYEAHITREQQKKSVWPYVMQYNSSADRAYSRSVENVGLGPALVRSFQIRVGERIYTQAEWRAVVDSLTGSDTARFFYSSLGDGSVLRPGERLEVLHIPPGRAAAVFFDHRSELRTSVCYCSLYGDCWLARSEKQEPSPVDRCVTGNGEAAPADTARGSIPADSEEAGG